jgi:hypothetical protein
MNADSDGGYAIVHPGDVAEIHGEAKVPGGL